MHALAMNPYIHHSGPRANSFCGKPLRLSYSYDENVGLAGEGKKVLGSAMA
jgi:hypothetical protein